MTASPDLTHARATAALVGILVPLCAALSFHALGILAAGASPQTAVSPWQQLLALPSESDISRRAEGSIKRVQEGLSVSDEAPVAGARRDGGYRARFASAVSLLPNRGSGNATGISVTVKISPALAEKFAPQDTLYIFAKVSKTSNHPLAIIRRRVATLPARVTLDDRMAVMPTAKLSSARQFIIGAHISKSGVAVPRSGDLQGFSRPLINGARGTVVMIDREVP